MTIPLELFQLPSLRNLYIDSNDLINFPLEQEVNLYKILIIFELVLRCKFIISVNRNSN